MRPSSRCSESASTAIEIGSCAAVSTVLPNGQAQRLRCEQREHAVRCSLRFGDWPARRYWMTSSARLSTDDGIINPRTFAVLRFTMSSNRVACSTGRSLGLAPLNSLST
jgi:hypothetical protein